MKKFMTAFAIVCAITLQSCSSDDSGEPVVDDDPVAGVVWKENGGGTEYSSTTAHLTEQYKTIMVKDANGATVLEINLTATSVGTYAIGSANMFTYTKVNPFFAGSAGNVVITSKSDTKVSGTFDVTGNAAGITSVKGTFTDIPVQP